MKLIDENGNDVVLGEDYPDFRGDIHTVVESIEPHKSSSTGRVLTSDDAVFYPGVFGFKWVEEG